MYVVCRASVGRRVPLLVPFFRANSTASAPEDPVPSPPKPSSARIASSWGDIAIPSREEILSSNARIASSWGDIVIPSREEILSKQTAAASYKPTLSHPVSDQSPGLAGPLAANLTSSPTPSVEKTSDGLQKQLIVETYESPEERTIRIQALAAARRAEREARERDAALLREAAEAARAAERAARTAATTKGAVLADQRRAERLHREAAMTPRQRFAHDASLVEGLPNLRQEPRPELRPRRVSPPQARSASKPSRFPRKPNFRIQTMPSQDANLANAKDDITLEIIEDGGDEKEPAEFTIPDVSFTNLDNLFKPSFERSVETVIRTPEASLSRGQMRILREAYGGDYRRFAPQTSEDCVTPPRQLGPLKHARSVLSHRSDVSTGARINALNIISEAVGGATSARSSKAIVS